MNLPSSSIVQPPPSSHVVQTFVLVGGVVHQLSELCMKQVSLMRMQEGASFHMRENEAVIRRSSDDAVASLDKKYLPLLRKVFIQRIWAATYPLDTGDPNYRKDCAAALKDPFPLPDFVRVGTSGIIVRHHRHSPNVVQHQYMRCSPKFYLKPMYDTVQVCT